ncbi:unnamed protein product, partial [Scytosiphon promiscuus]
RHGTCKVDRYPFRNAWQAQVFICDTVPFVAPSAPLRCWFQGGSGWPRGTLVGRGVIVDGRGGWRFPAEQAATIATASTRA